MAISDTRPSFRIARGGPEQDPEGDDRDSGENQGPVPLASCFHANRALTATASGTAAFQLEISSRAEGWDQALTCLEGLAGSSNPSQQLAKVTDGRAGGEDRIRVLRMNVCYQDATAHAWLYAAACFEAHEQEACGRKPRAWRDILSTGHPPYIHTLESRRSMLMGIFATSNAITRDIPPSTLNRSIQALVDSWSSNQLGKHTLKHIPKPCSESPDSSRLMATLLRTPLLPNQPHILNPACTTNDIISYQGIPFCIASAMLHVRNSPLSGHYTCRLINSWYDAGTEDISVPLGWKTDDARRATDHLTLSVKGTSCAFLGHSLSVVQS